MSLSICFGYDSSEPSGRGQKNVLVIQNVCAVNNYFIGFTEYLLFVKAVAEVCLRPVILLLIFTTRCNVFLCFWLTFPKQHIKEYVKTLCI